MAIYSLTNKNNKPPKQRETTQLGMNIWCCTIQWNALVLTCAGSDEDLKGADPEAWTCLNQAWTNRNSRVKYTFTCFSHMCVQMYAWKIAIYSLTNKNNKPPQQRETTQFGMNIWCRTIQWNALVVTCVLMRTSKGRTRRHEPVWIRLELIETHASNILLPVFHRVFINSRVMYVLRLLFTRHTLFFPLSRVT